MMTKLVELRAEGWNKASTAPAYNPYADSSKQYETEALAGPQPHLQNIPNQ